MHVVYERSLQVGKKIIQTYSVIYATVLSFSMYNEMNIFQVKPHFSDRNFDSTDLAHFIRDDFMIVLALHV